MADYAVGDTVYASFGRYGRVCVRVGKVEKVTPTGQVVVAFTGRLDRLRFKDGWEIGGDRHHSAFLVDQVKYDYIKLEMNDQQARREIGKIIGGISTGGEPSTIIASLEQALTLARQLNDGNGNAT